MSDNNPNPNPNPTGPAPAPPAPAPTNGGPTNLPQEQIDAIIQDRLARERRSQEDRLKELGVSSWDDLKGLVAEKRKREEDELISQQKYKELADKIRSEKDAEIAKLSSEREKLLTQYRSQSAERTVLAAATNHNAVAPEQVAALLRENIRVGEDGAAFVAGQDGQPLTDGKGNQLQVGDFVKDFLEKNPHFVRAAPGVGANGRAPTGQPSQGQGFDLTRRGDLDYMREHGDELLAAARAGKIRL